MTTIDTTATGADARVTMPGRSWSTARTAGVLYLTIFVCGLFAELVVRSRLIVRDDPAATATNLLESAGLFRIGVAADVVLFLILRPLSPPLALLAGAFRLVQSSVLGLNLLSMFQALWILDDADYLGISGTEQVEALALLSLDTHRYGYILGLVFFGVATMIIGYLAWRAPQMPSGLGVVLGLAGAGYVVDAAMFLMIPGYDGAVSAVVLAPALIGELWFGLWLLTRGRVLDAGARSWA
jgi:hypothetical protein